MAGLCRVLDIIFILTHRNLRCGGEWPLGLGVRDTYWDKYRVGVVTCLDLGW